MRGDPASGCALCGAEWGDHRASVQGEELRFCCGDCARFYELAVREAARQTGWPRVDRLFLDSVRGSEGDGWARRGEERIEIHVRGTPDGSQLLEFKIQRRAKLPSP